jgi:poly-gamma-glutamate capsule biosynthesis protein CapA/YwtB (metallophosphatase superfamily)
MKHHLVNRERRRLVQLLGGAMLGMLTLGSDAPVLHGAGAAMPQAGQPPSGNAHAITIFLCGDVMIGRGIDQVLPHPGDPRLYEAYMKSARGYVELAVRANGPIPAPVDFAYIWGDALDVFTRVAPDVRIINLETAVTTSDAYWPDKGIHYRGHPANLPCLTAARIDCCVLSNNHVLDWGYAGLIETLDALRELPVQTVGAGRNLEEAQAPAVLDVAGKGRVLVWAYGAVTSGIPSSWAATPEQPGVNLLTDLSETTVRQIAGQVKTRKQAGDIVVVSLHWGGNWGYSVPLAHRRFAHQLLAEAGVDIVHGHSSHHPKGIEVFRDKPIFYGCGDFFTDYEGISGYEAFRDDLTLMYFVTMAPGAGTLERLAMTPMQLKRLRLNRALAAEAQWLRDVLTREGRRFGTRAVMHADNTLTLHWR